MIIDVTGIELTPGNGGKNCLGNGEHYYDNGEQYECCCDACGYMLCCYIEPSPAECAECIYVECPRSGKTNE